MRAAGYHIRTHNLNCATARGSQPDLADSEAVSAILGFYGSIVENKPVSGGKVVQRHLLYLVWARSTTIRAMRSRYAPLRHQRHHH